MLTATRGGGAGPVVAVTGASGMLGRHLCRYFLRRGWEVRALLRRSSSAKGLEGVSRVGRCDLPDIVDEAALAGVTAVVHCAYATRTPDLTEARRVNEEGTARLLAAARRCAVPRLVFISSVTASAQAPSYYARSKHAVEGSLDPDRDLAVRLGLVLAREGEGLFQRMRELARRVRVVPLFDGGRQPLQTVHVADACEAIARAVERDLTGVLRVAEPEPIAMRAFLRLLVQRLGVRCLFLPLPLRPTLAIVRTMERAGLPAPLRSESLLGLRALRVVAVTDDLRRLDLSVRCAAAALEDVA